MSYVRRVLVPGEKLRYRTKIHWTVFAPGLLFLVPGIVIVLITLKSDADGSFWMLVAAALLLTAAIMLLGEWFHRRTTEIAVTSKRIIYKRGFVRRHAIEMNLDKVESVDIDQSMLGRLLGYGDIAIRGVGVGLEPLRHIDHPIAFRNQVIAK